MKFRMHGIILSLFFALALCFSRWHFVFRSAFRHPLMTIQGLTNKRPIRIQM